jgi:hypothetical protein
MNTKYVAQFPFLPILTLIFITLKLTGYIAWSWFWVLSPTLIPLLVVLFFFGLILLVKALGK